jgi:hypothetical protein
MEQKKYDNRRTFVLFTEENVNPKAPNLKGTYTDENNKEWEIKAWKKTSKAGKQFLSGKIEEKKNYPSKSDEPDF